LPFMIEEAGRTGRALRSGEWKYIAGAHQDGAKEQGRQAELYNLKSDPGERHNIIAQHPEKAESMAKQLTELMNAKGVR